MLCSVSRFDCFERPEERNTAVGASTAESGPGDTRRARQTERIKSLGVADTPVFQSAMHKLVAQGGVRPRYVEIKPLVRRLQWQDLPPAVSPAGGHVPEVECTISPCK